LKLHRRWQFPNWLIHAVNYLPCEENHLMSVPCLRRSQAGRALIDLSLAAVNRNRAGIISTNPFA
jgi:hypothetical protein